MSRKYPNARLLALLLAVLCLFGCVTVALSFGDMDHDCAGEQCFLCLCLSLRQGMADVLALPASLCVLVYFVFKWGIPHQNVIVPASWTPVCLKVKLSD